MNKRHGASSTKQKNRSEDTHKKRKVISSKNTNKLILPVLKDNLEEDNNNNNENIKKHPTHKINNDKIKNRLSSNYPNNNNNNFFSPIHTELVNKSKRASNDVIENSKIKLKLKDLSSNQILKVRINEEDKPKKNNKKSGNIFNRSNKKKSQHKGSADILPLISNSKNNDTKLPLIEKNLLLNKGENKINIQNNNKNTNENKYESLLHSKSLFKDQKYATYSKMGLEEGGKAKENNQDMSIILNNVCEYENYSIYGIMDGHGSNGHLVSNFVKEKIEEYFNNKKLFTKKKSITGFSPMDVDNSSKIYEKLKSHDYELIRKFYKNVNEELYNTKFDVHFSGTTCILVFKVGKKLICSNVGDSRAILINEKSNMFDKNDILKNNYEFIQLSRDHKPNKTEERERIEKLGGEVAQEYFMDSEEPAGPFRVWCKGCDYPGIAISRSLGDKIAESIGVIWEPDILEFDIESNSKYIIMGSDGLFDYLTNDEIKTIAFPSLIVNNPAKACFDLVEKEYTTFQQKENRVDDITINIIIL